MSSGVADPRRLARTVAEVDLRALDGNLTRLASAARDRYVRLSGTVPMVKCNAYGHGLAPVGLKLERNASTLALGVATIEEGLVLRQAGVHKPIWVFSDCGPWNDERASALAHARLTPVIHSLEDLRRLLERSPAMAARGFHLKFNTGMNRLGIPLSEAQAVYRVLERRRARPEGLCMHLAVAEDSGHRLTRAQIEAFRELVAGFSAFGASHIHCSNTSAILHEKALGLGKFCTAVRPGIGLYGYGGAEGEKLGLKPALKLRARVVAARVLERAALVGYGATFRAAAQTSQTVLSIGYGDGFMRALSNKKLAIASGRGRLVEARVLGRVSMDLSSIELRSKPGSWVTLLGETGEQGERMAEAAGTIVYEVLTAISSRVPRVFRR